MALPNRYDGFDFEPYVYREYPKQVIYDGKDRIVNSAEEEAELLAASLVVKPIASQPKPMTHEEEKEYLLKRAAELGIEVDKRLGVNKLKMALKEESEAE